MITKSLVEIRESLEVKSKRQKELRYKSSLTELEASEFEILNSEVGMLVIQELLLAAFARKQMPYKVELEDSLAADLSSNFCVAESIDKCNVLPPKYNL